MVWLTAAVAFIGGGVILVVELSAVRLLAPWFGASSQVWTHVIGVILLALSAGYALGSRLSAREQPARVAGIALALAAIWVACLPAMAQPLAEWLLPPGLSLERASSGIGWASLAASAALFAPCALLLSTLSPLLTECLQRAQGGGAGQAGGRILAAGTLGSLVGSFLTTYWLIPKLGLQATFHGCGLALAVLAVALLWRGMHAGTSRALLVLLPAGVLACALASPWKRPVLPEGASLIAQAESSYQSIRIVERDGLRLLQVNEGLDSFQSVWQSTTGPLGGGYYYDAFVLPALWSESERGAGAGAPWRLLVLGQGAGTVWRVFEGVREVSGDGVEIDPQVVALGTEHMPLTPQPSRRVHSGLDARMALAALPGPYDQIVVDAYANQTEIPAHLASAEFFAATWQRLAPGGWLCLNVGAFGLDDPLLEAIGGTLSSACGTPVLCCRLPFARNVLVLARKGGALCLPEDSRFAPAEPEALRRLAESFALPGATRVLTSTGRPPLTDDHAPLEALVRASLKRGTRTGAAQ